MKAIYDSKFVYRTVPGIADASKLTKDQVQLALDGLADDGLVARKITSKRTWLWKLTKAGEALMGRQNDA